MHHLPLFFVRLHRPIAKIRGKKPKSVKKCCCCVCVNDSKLRSLIKEDELKSTIVYVLPIGYTDYFCFNVQNEPCSIPHSRSNCVNEAAVREYEHRLKRITMHIKAKMGCDLIYFRLDFLFGWIIWKVFFPGLISLFRSLRNANNTHTHTHSHSHRKSAVSIRCVCVDLMAFSGIYIFSFGVKMLVWFPVTGEYIDCSNELWTSDIGDC